MIDPAQYHSTPAYDLLLAASKGEVGIDQRLLHALVDHPENTLSDILRFASQGSHEPIDLEPDLIAILHYLRTPEALPFFIGLVRAYLEELPDDLTEAIVALGEPALEPLLDLHREIPEDQAGEIAFLLAELQIHDPRVLEILLERLEYDAHDGALLLEIYGDPAAIPAIEKIAAEIVDDDELRDDLLDSARNVRAQPEPYEWDFDIWQRYPAEALPEFDLLNDEDRMSLLASDSAELRAGAAYSYRDEPYSPEVLTRLLDLARNDPDPKVRGNAWAALADHVGEPEIQRSVTAVLLDPSRPLAERSGAALALSDEAASRPEIFRALEELYRHIESRAAALEAMGRSFDRRFGKYAAQTLNDPKLSIQRQAIRAVGFLALHAEAARLLKFFADPDLRDEALHAYAMSAPNVRGLDKKIEKLAGGLTEDERATVQDALEFRRQLRGARSQRAASALKPTPA